MSVNPWRLDPSGARTGGDPPPPTPVRHVLLVEDHDGVRDVITRALRRHRVRVSEAATAPQAHAVLANDTPGLVVLDIALPGGMNGIELARWIRLRHAAMPIVFITGLTDWNVRGEVPDGPAVRLLRKPFGAQEIADTVVALLMADPATPGLSATTHLPATMGWRLAGTPEALRPVRF